MPEPESSIVNNGEIPDGPRDSRERRYSVDKRPGSPHSRSRSRSLSAGPRDPSRSPRRSLSPPRDYSRSPRRSRRDYSRSPSISRSRSRSWSRSRSRSYSRSPSYSRSRSRSRSFSRSRSRSLSPSFKSRRRRGGDRRSKDKPIYGKIAIDNLRINVREDHIREIFGGYGKIETVWFTKPNERIKKLKNIQGYSCYILYQTPGQARRAECFMDGGMIDNIKVFVKCLKGPSTTERPNTRKSFPKSKDRRVKRKRRGVDTYRPKRQRSYSPDYNDRRGKRSRNYSRSRSRSMSRSRSPDFSPNRRRRSYSRSLSRSYSPPPRK